MSYKKPETVKDKFYYIIKDRVTEISLAAAVVSMFFVHPSKKYLHYIDFRVLSLIFALMIVVAGFKRAGTLDYVISAVLRFVDDTRDLAFVLIGLCFFSSMFITNDVALITFVPLTIMIFKKINNNKLLIYIIVMQNLAANMGSVLTPIGSPQNLYVFSKYNMNTFEFIKLMSVPFIISAIYIFILIKKVKKDSIGINNNQKVKQNTRKVIIWTVLFILSLLSVMRIVSYKIVIVACIIAAIILDRKIFLDVNYNLLLIFVFLFIFTGNISSIPKIHKILYEFINKRTFLVSLILSQVVSNVPSTMLLANFTDNFRELIVGADIAGLGTLIGSMASIISLQLYLATDSADKKQFMKAFTIVNLILLIILIPLMLIYLKFFNNIF